MTANFQINLYHFLNQYIAQHGFSPSFAEMTVGMGISPNSKSLISRSLRSLQKSGKVRLKKEGRRLLISVVGKL